ncbi:MAG: hypothetical protein IJQ81_05250 [Oscillibacter sp.]|nr:hypothetical protein [Oscillibacter sp.]
MAQTTHFFAGANGGDGFQNLFPEIIDLNDALDFIILKGGPGVGKNTFLRELGRTMEEAGTAVEYLHCSGDPDSLDGVVFPEIRCAAADGTSPHVLEPRYPAAVDRYLDLGRFYDLISAKENAAAVKAHTEQYKAAYVRAYRALNAARVLERDAAARVSFDHARAERRFRGIASRELRRKGTQQGRTVRRFLGSLTYQGYLWRFESADALCPRLYELQDRFGFAAPMLETLRREACARHWDTLCCMSPENPEQIEHLLIPGLGVGFVTSRPGMEYGGVPFRRVRLDALADIPDKGAFRLESRMITALREEAVSALRDAKAAHDKLEAVYNPYVDFDGVRALAALESGRLLNWLQLRRAKRRP